jgi:polyhydroxybutyrate depolymerase
VPSTGDLVRGELTIGGRPRTFTLTLPPSPDTEVPLVLVLHGNMPGRGGSAMRTGTTFDAQAGPRGLAVAYPDGVGGCWADGRGVTTADEAGVDDVAFLRAIIGWSADRHGTCAERAVVAGASNGAFMAHRLALAASDQVAVLAAVSGGLPAALTREEPGHAVSALLIHGTSDPLVPVEGGWSRHRGPGGELRGRTISLQETADRWQAIDRCPPGPGTAGTAAAWTRHTSAPGTGGTQVATLTVTGGGHGWFGPGWPAPPGCDLDAAAEICRFAEPLLIPAPARQR